MISALEGLPDIVVEQRSPLPDLPPQLYFDLTSVQSEGKAIGPYNPVATYDSRWSITGIGSQYWKTSRISYPRHFANVIGSSGDPKVKSLSWIRLWERYCGQRRPDECSSRGYPLGFRCGRKIVGGHAVRGHQAREVKPGSWEVFIIPICHEHNMNDANDMQLPPGTSVSIVCLQNYMK
jgi:hypothetical protein